MRIGELARRGAVSVQAVRFYEREGLLRRAPRTPAGYRLYTADDLAQVRFVKRCQKLGFTLREIGLIGALHGAGAASRPRAAAIADFLRIANARLTFLDVKIADLRKMRRQVAAMVREATRHPRGGCPAGGDTSAGARTAAS
jgi:MerR family copper efflux transcriptional regulator